MNLRVYALTSHVLTRLKRTEQNKCRICDSDFQISDMIVSKHVNSSNYHSSHYHKKCAEKVNVI